MGWLIILRKYVKVHCEALSTILPGKVKKKQTAKCKNESLKLNTFFIRPSKYFSDLSKVCRRAR